MVEENIDSKKLVRCFIALELSREAINYLEEIQTLIKKKNLFYGKFTEPENLHLTLKFLGEIPEEKVKLVQEKLKEIKNKEFEIELGELGFFTEKSFRIVWVKLVSKAIWELQTIIDDKLRDLFEKEKRFMSHVTLARIKKVIDKKIFLDYIKNMKIKPIKLKISEFTLKKSELTREGPNYSDVERYKLL